MDNQGREENEAWKERGSKIGKLGGERVDLLAACKY